MARRRGAVPPATTAADRDLWLMFYSSAINGVLASQDSEPDKEWVTDWSAEMADIALAKAKQKLGEQKT